MAQGADNGGIQNPFPRVHISILVIAGGEMMLSIH